MSKSVMTDAGVGRALFTTKFGLSIQAFYMCFWFGMIPAFFIPMMYWFSSASTKDVSFVKIEVLTHIYSADTPRVWRITDNNGVRRTLSATLRDGRVVTVFTPFQINAALKQNGMWSPIKRFYFYLYLSIALSFTGYLFLWFVLSKAGSKNQKNRRIGGADYVVSWKELNKIVLKREAKKLFMFAFLWRLYRAPYFLAGVALPRTAPVTGINMIGSIGTGKSIAIHDLMRQVFRKKRKCVIYDQSGEFYRAHFRPGKDFFFNPAMIGSVAWSLPGELKYSYDADSMGRAFLPPKNEGTGGPNSFFEDAARALFSVILLRLRESGAQHTSDIAKAFLEMPDDEMAFLIRNSIASSAIAGDSKAQRQGVISSIAIFLNGIAAVQKGSWTIREFLDSPDDSRLFILGTEDTRAMFAPLFRLLLSVAFSAIESKQEIVHEDRYWFWLDEVHSLGDIRLDEKLATLRKFGVAIVTGVQSDQQYMAALGPQRGEVVMNCFNTFLLLRANDDKLQERISRKLGKVEETVVNRNQQLAVTEWRDGGGLNQTDREKFIVSPAEIGKLENCTGYLKLVGDFPAAKVDYSSWLPRWPGAKSRLDLWKEVNPQPERDSSFIIQVDSSKDVFVAAREGAQRTREAASGTENEVVPAQTTVWRQVEDTPSTTPDLNTNQNPKHHPKASSSTRDAVNTLPLF